MNPETVNAPSAAPAPAPEVQSFVPYTGKAPILVQIVGGLLWLGAAGLLIFGVLSLIVNVILGIIILAVAVFTIITAKSLFKMKRSAIQNSIILAILLVIITGYSMITSEGSSSFGFVYAIALLAIAYFYRGQFVR